MEYDGEHHATPIQLSERFSRFVNFLGEHDGSYQGRIPDVAEAIGVTEKAFRKIKERAVALGVVRIQTNGTVMGIGRFPDSYHLRIDIADWPRLRQHFAEKWQAEKEARIKRGEMLKARRAAQRKIEKARERAIVHAPKRAWPPPPMPPPTPAEELLAAPAADELDVDAWLEAGDF